MNAAIEVRGLTKIYDGHTVVRNLDWTVNTGSACAFLGANGAGKSTTLRMLMGFTPRDGGEARVLGEDVWNPSAEVRARMGYVAEESILPAWAKVETLVELHRHLYPRWNRDFEAELRDLLQVPYGSRVATLSKGQKRRAMLLLALSQSPDLLILDEPASGLDVEGRRELLGLLGRFLVDEGHSLVLSTHIVSDVERFASDVAVIRRGQLLEHAPLDELQENVKLLRVPEALYQQKPDAWDCAEILSNESVGATRVLTVRHANRLGDLDALGSGIESIVMSIEDIYLALTRQGIERDSGLEERAIA